MAASFDLCGENGFLKQWRLYHLWDKYCAVPAPNTAPTVVITQPAFGSTVSETQGVTLQAAASDKEDGDISGNVKWFSSRDGSIASGNRLSAGTHTIKAEVFDSNGASASDSIQLTVAAANTAPVVSIVSPAGGSVITAGESVTLAAQASDKEQGDLSGSVKWSSSVDGSISSPATLSVGDHVLTATVTDNNGAMDQAKVSVTVKAANSAPVVSIVSPVSGAVITAGESVALTAQASDKEQGDLSGSVIWSSSVDGSISSPATLSAGDHVLTATVVDNSGARDQATVSITVKAVSSVPVVTIQAPTDGAVIKEGEPVSLVATAIDKEDGDISDQVRWTSTLDGTIKNGMQLVVGTHTIKARLRDSDGEYGSDTVQVTVVAANTNAAPEVSILSPSDNSAFGEGVSLNLQASASDAEDGDLSAQVTWSSSLDGALSNPTTLSAGTHTLTATVKDSAGVTDSDTVVVSVTVVNSGPVISILAPTDGSSVEEGSSLLLSAEASDEEDGDLSQEVVWTSSLDGEIADVTTLSAGDHLITATVTDSQGVVASDEVFLTVIGNEPEPVARSLTISWVAPTRRADGEPLYPEHLLGYEIRMVNAATGESRVVDLADGLATTYTTEPLMPGTYELTLRAYDDQNLFSDPTAPITATISEY